MSEWQPIETAPKDGTVIDLWNGESRLADCRWDMPGRDGFGYRAGPDKPCWVQMDCDVSGTSFLTYVGEPTHWMPLPPQPQK